MGNRNLTTPHTRVGKNDKKTKKHEGKTKTMKKTHGKLEKRETTKKTMCVSNDRSGQCDQNAYRIIKIGVIFGYFRAFTVWKFLAVRTVVGANILKVFLAVRTVVGANILGAR